MKYVIKNMCFVLVLSALSQVASADERAYPKAEPDAIKVTPKGVEVKPAPVPKKKLATPKKRTLALQPQKSSDEWKKNAERIACQGAQKPKHEPACTMPNP